MARKNPWAGFGGGSARGQFNQRRRSGGGGGASPPGGPWYGSNSGAGSAKHLPGMQAKQPWNRFDPTAHPRYQQALAGMNAMGESDLANSRQAIQQALIAFGATPEGFNDQFGSLDENTRNLIAKNTQGGLSTVAQLNEQRTDAVKQLVNNLSARGLRRSGAKGAGLKRRQKDYDRAYAASLQKLLGMANGIYGQYAQNQFGRQQQLQDYYWNIGDQYGFAPYQDPWNPSAGGGGSGGGGGGGSAAPPPGGGGGGGRRGKWWVE